MPDDDRARVRELEAIARIASSFTFERPLESMMDEAAQQVVGASGSALACIIGIADDTAQLTRVIGGDRLPAGFRELLERAWRDGGTRVVSTSLATRNTQVYDIAKMPQLRGYDAVRVAQEAAGWGLLAVVPMMYRGKALGLVIVPYPAGDLPAPAELSFLEAIADQVAVGLENALLFDRAQAVAVAEERQRISRELHDSVSQALYGISLGAQTARELLDIEPTRAIEPVDYILTLANVGLTEMRAMIFELRPDALASEGVASAIRRLALAAQARQGLAVDAQLIEEPDIPLDAKQMLYRVAQEAIENVLKHAQASGLQVSLTSEAGRLRLEVGDNGRGFDADAAFPGHLGLTSMRERAEREGATFAVTSAPGAGTTVVVTLPLRTASN